MDYEVRMDGRVVDAILREGTVLSLSYTYGHADVDVAHLLSNFFFGLANR